MKSVRLLPVILLSLLVSCAPKKIEIPLTEVPAGPLVEALEQRNRSFLSLRALASITVVRKDRKRVFESVAVLVTQQERFKIEAYGPLGQSLATIVWKGKDLLVDLNGEQRVLPAQGSVLERVLGADVAPEDLCAVLSGNVPGILARPGARMACARNNNCILELDGDGRQVKIFPAIGWEPGGFPLSSFEVYRDKKLIYRVRYASPDPAAGYALPRQILVENPGKQMSLTLDYAEADVNIPLDSALFVLPGQEAAR